MVSYTFVGEEPKPTKIEGTSYFMRKYLVRKDNEVGVVFLGRKSKESKNIDVIGITELGESKPVTYFIFKDDVPILQRKKVVAAIMNLRKQDIETVKLKEDVREKSSYIYYVTSVVIGLLVLATYGRLFWKKIVTAAVEKEAAVKEEELNKILFNPTRGKDSLFSDYASLISNVKMLLSNGKDKNLLVVYGVPGTGKTYVVRRTLYIQGLTYGKDYTIFKGATSDLWSLYVVLYKYRNKIIVLDDCDDFLKNTEGINVLKAATDTMPIRIVSLSKSMSAVSSDALQVLDAPQKFLFSGKVILLTNLRKDQIDTALLSRGLVVNLSFDGKKILEVIEKMLEFLAPQASMDVKREVLNFLVDMYSTGKITHIDLRTFLAITDLRIAYPDDWKTIALDMYGKGK